MLSLPLVFSTDDVKLLLSSVTVFFSLGYFWWMEETLSTTTNRKNKERKKKQKTAYPNHISFSNLMLGMIRIPPTFSLFRQL